ncbi:hypothetical protein [Brucella anthropi]|uniref:hypothetical protein n=1 Tax=Brucella anthropi TaxID=529 RepID=UPI003D9726EF
MSDEYTTINLSPYSRLALTFQEEMKRDEDGRFFNDNLYQSYIQMYKEAVKRRDAIFKSVILLDFIALLVYYGRDIKIPVVNVGFSDVPGGFLSIVLLSSLSFLFFAISFANEQFYKCIAHQFNVRKAEKLGIDPDYLSAADIFEDIALKVFRRRMSIFTKDYYEPSKGYRVAFGSMTTAMLVVVMLMFSMHLFFSISVSALTYTSQSKSLLTILLASATIITNIVSLAILLTQNISFKFNFAWRVIDQSHRQSFDNKTAIYGNIIVSSGAVPSIENVGYIRGARLFYNNEGNPSSLNIHHECNGVPKELCLSFRDFVFLLSILKAIQLDHNIPFPDDPRMPDSTR